MFHQRSMTGLGVYSLTEVARYVHMHPSTARAWFRGRPDGPGGALLTSDHPQVKGAFAVSFLDLVDALLVREFRTVGVPMGTIRRAYECLAADLGTRHPFAHGDLYTDGRRVIVGISDEVGEQALHDAISRQGFFTEMRDCLERVKYDDTTRLATRWMIADDVVIDPMARFGTPTVEGTATRTAVIADQYKANGRDAGLVADLFAISEHQVLQAVEFEQSISSSAAA